MFKPGQVVTPKKVTVDVATDDVELRPGERFIVKKLHGRNMYVEPTDPSFDDDQLLVRTDEFELAEAKKTAQEARKRLQEMNAKLAGKAGKMALDNEAAMEKMVGAATRLLSLMSTAKMRGITVDALFTLIANELDDILVARDALRRAAVDTVKMAHRYAPDEEGDMG